VSLHILSKALHEIADVVMGFELHVLVFGVFMDLSTLDELR
jgi:hypothetical protein